jgi:DNA transformation protein and related proteins
MAVTADEITLMHDMFADLGNITSRKMMGGLSIYCEGIIFAILSSESTIYLKAKGEFADEMAAAGARQFSMVNKHGKTSSMGYWTMPDEGLDDFDLACDWARRALQHL